MPSTQPPAASPSQSTGWSPWARFVVSVVLAIHLGCVLLAASTVPPTSQVLISLHRLFAPYLQAMYLNHGYRFFAPEPGPNHSVEYTFSDGNGGRFPNRTLWPRLRYHRWFMLSESLYRDASQLADRDQQQAMSREARRMAEELRSQGRLREAAALESQRQQQQVQLAQMEAMVREFCESVRQALQRSRGGEGTRLFSVTRELPAPEDILAGVRLDDPRYLPVEGRINLQTLARGARTVEEMEPPR